MSMMEIMEKLNYNFENRENKTEIHTPLISTILSNDNISLEDKEQAILWGELSDEANVRNIINDFQNRPLESTASIKL